MAGIYIHIPFCKQACHYCNFHFSTSMKYMDDMVDAICHEIKLRAEYLAGEDLNSIYFGGGTPSVLTEKGLEKILDTVYRSFKVNGSAEVTLEANPDDLDARKVKELAQSSVNRLSIGVQSFYEEDLKWMNRAHNAEESKRCIQVAQDFGFDNLTIDLIFGLPHSDHGKWKSNMKQAVDFRIPHISMYSLTVEEGTALGKFVERGREIEAPDDYIMQQFDMGIDYLEGVGYKQYEISNYALPGKEAVHNSNYWKSQAYLGVGPSAHSFNGHSRSMNIAHNAKYMQVLKDGGLPLETEPIDARTSYNEYVMTRLRTTWGVDPNELLTFKGHFESEVRKLIKKGWVTFDESIYTLTREGKHFADAAAMELFVD